MPSRRAGSAAANIKRDIDRTLLREQLRKTPDERVRELVALEQFADKLRRAVRRTGT